MPDVLKQVGRAASVTQVAKRLSDMTAALGKNLDVMGGQRARPLIDEGVELRNQLTSADAEQERKRLAGLPDVVRDLCAAKGTILVGLKIINDAGHELHADDSTAAGRYHLKILYRRA